MAKRNKPNLQILDIKISSSFTPLTALTFAHKLIAHRSIDLPFTATLDSQPSSCEQTKLVGSCGGPPLPMVVSTLPSLSLNRTIYLQCVKLFVWALRKPEAEYPLFYAALIRRYDELSNLQVRMLGCECFQ